MREPGEKACIMRLVSRPGEVKNPGELWPGLPKLDTRVQLGKV